MSLKAVLFDMDGVIVNTEPVHKKSFFKMFEDFNINVPNDLYNSLLGSSTKQICEILIEKFNLDKTAEELTKVKQDYLKYYFLNGSELNLIEGVEELIKHYYDNGIKMVLASSANMTTINWVFERFDLDKYFIGKISGATLKESKPNPEIFIKASEIANEPKENCMVIEDSTNGILAAYRAGIFCSAYKSFHSKNQDYSKANILIEDYKELRLDKIKKHF